MNTLKFEVYKNTIKRRDGFNPVLGEKNYTKIKCYFMESDWDNCSLVTANFMSEKDNIVKSTVSLTEDKTAEFDLPTDIDGDKIYFSLTGSYDDNSGNTVTLNTNIVGINRQKGLLPSKTVNFGLYEKILGFYNKMNALYNQLKDEKISKGEGSVITAYLADEAVTKAKLSSDLNTLIGEKANSSELFDVTKSINLANLADYSQHQNGVTITVSKNKISLIGTSTVAINLFVPLKSPITLQANKPYCLSLQDFTTNNTGCVFYPANGQNVINSKWLLSEVSALKNAAATYIPTQDTIVDSIKIAIATGRLTTNSCYLQIEENNQKTAYANPDKIVKKVKPTLYQGPDYAMHYLYVSNDYNEDTEGYGDTKFNSILSANNSISDNSYHNRYTIIVMAGTYTDMQDKYAGMSDVGLVGYRGVMMKDYVYYESENIYNPQATIIKWDGATGFDKSTLKSEDIIKKCPFHLDLNVHTHIKGFTFDCKNIRYALHLESGGTGYATNWVVGHCTFIWGGRADCVDYANKTTVPVFGCGHSFGEVGLIENCKIIPTHCTIGYQNHDNADNSDFGLPIKVGAKITFKDCDFGGTEIQARTLKGAYADTPNVLTIDGCVNVSAINKMYAAPADHCDWVIKGAD